MINFRIHSSSFSDSNPCNNPKASPTVVIGPVCNTVSILDAKEHNYNHHHNHINYNYNNNHNSEDHSKANNPITNTIYNYSEVI